VLQRGGEKKKNGEKERKKRPDPLSPHESSVIGA
jgi:hypothetical protein